MQQIVLKEPGHFVARTAPEPTVAEDEALVRVHRVGVCGTDLHAFKGRQPGLIPRSLAGAATTSTPNSWPRMRGYSK